MNAIVRFALRAFVLALCFYLVEQFLPQHHGSQADALGAAVVWGVVMQVASEGGKRVTPAMKRRFGPAIFAVGSLVMFGVAVVCWTTSAPHSTGTAMLPSLFFGALGIAGLACAWTMRRQRDQETVAAVE